LVEDLWLNFAFWEVTGAYKAAFFRTSITCKNQCTLEIFSG